MRSATICLLVALVVPGLATGQGTGTQVPDADIILDSGWRFHRGPAEGAQDPAFVDTSWRAVDLPHDWGIENLPGTHSPFTPDALNGVSVGFTVAGTGWYRKTFFIEDAQKGLYTAFRFDGVYMNADVWLNGVYLGYHPYGYTSFILDGAKALHYGAENVLAVRVRNEGTNSRWYAGSGIYRHVWMEIRPTVRLADWGVAITTPAVSTDQARVHVRTHIVARPGGLVGPGSGVSVLTRLLDAKGIEVASGRAEVAATMDTAVAEQDLTVPHPALWGPGHPALYEAVTEVYVDGRLMDRQTRSFGIRTISWDAVHGFQLNGHTIKLKGGCFHDDHGPLGAKSFDRAEERRVRLFLASGYNAIRCSHNPPAPAFLEACDRLGLLVIDEAFDCWETGKNPEDYNIYFDVWWKRDINSMVFRDRNHPSIVGWSIGNEIPDMDNPRGPVLAHMLADYVRGLDPTRPILAAVNSVDDQKDSFISALDIAGYNYSRGRYDVDHQRHPDRVMVATESYPWEAYAYWKAVEERPWVIGDFVWTAWDYIGEASIGWRGYPQETNFYPWNLAYCGDIDICGWKRAASYYRDALWRTGGDNISLFVEPPVPSWPLNPKKADWSLWNWHDAVADWNWNGYEGQPINIEVYSTAPRAELFLNGRSLGRKAVDSCIVRWTVPYRKGTLKVVGYLANGKTVTSSLSTAGKVVRMRLTSDRVHLRADGEDLSYVTVELLDTAGVRNPKAGNLLHFHLEGPGTIAGVGNGNPTSLESYVDPQRSCWRGRCLVVLRSGYHPGTLRLTVTGEGLPAKTITLHVEK